MRLRLKQLNPLGDTIVEVMVVLAILGLALSISYTTASRSILNTRQAEQNAQATRLVQSQLDALRSVSYAGTINCSSDPSPGTNIFCQKDPFCMVGSSIVSINKKQCLSNNLYTTLIFNCNKAYTDSYMSAWKNICEIGISPSIRPYSFVIEVSWPDVAGQGTDTVQQTYEAYPQS